MAIKNAGIGVDLDTYSIRAAKIRYSGSGKKETPVIMAMEEVTGNYVKDEDVVEGLKALRQKLPVSSLDTVVTCVGGKQTYAAQISFRKLPDEEMKNALKFEIRKNLPFDTAGASIDYQYIGAGSKKNETVPVITTAVSNIILQRYLRLFEKAGMPPEIIDVFPLTIANAYHVLSEHHTVSEKTGILLHMGNEFSTLVIDGEGVPFFNRTIYFSAGEMFGPSRNDTMATREIERRTTSFTEEIVRSLAYYETTWHAKTSRTIMILGNFLMPELLDKIRKDTGLEVVMMDLVKVIDPKRETIPGKFDLAITLGMRR